MPIPSVLSRVRKRRSTINSSKDQKSEFEDEKSAFIFVYEPNMITKEDRNTSTRLKPSCALNSENTKRLKTPYLDTNNGLGNITTSKLKQNKVYTQLGSNIFEQLPRTKRKISLKTSDKYIELAVFVDDDLYKYVKTDTDKTGGDPIESIQDVVFAYLNAVSKPN